MKAIAGAGGGEEFGYDADWDDDWDIDRSLLGDDEGDAAALGGEDGMPGSREDGEVDVAALSVVPESDADVTELTEAWVQSGEDGLARQCTRIPQDSPNEKS